MYSRSGNARFIAGAAILAIQVGMIGYARFVPTRYLCWAPYDEIVFYDVQVDTRRGSLTAAEALDRYRLPERKRNNRSWAHITSAIVDFERAHGRDDAARVRLRYTVNGRGPFVWRWPEQGAHEPGVPQSKR
jgi:hypothetical protein